MGRGERERGEQEDGNKGEVLVIYVKGERRVDNKEENKKIKQENKTIDNKEENMKIKQENKTRSQNSNNY